MECQWNFVGMARLANSGAQWLALMSIILDGVGRSGDLSWRSNTSIKPSVMA